MGLDNAMKISHFQVPYYRGKMLSSLHTTKVESNCATEGTQTRFSGGPETMTLNELLVNTPATIGGLEEI